MACDKKLDNALPEGSVVKSGKNTYRVVKVLGAGGFGITYKVIRQDGVVFAMKEFFRKELCERDEAQTISYLKSNKSTIETGIEDFITEAGRLNKQSISHPNIVSIYEVFKANNTAYYIMEYIAGVDLLHYIKKNGNRPLSLEQAISVMRPILQATALLHKNNITHLDIKHENIILTKEDDNSLRPVLIDFGLSKHYDKKGKATSTLTAAGCTDGFAPIEQYSGLTEFTPQADVYALGATLLYLLSAKWPVKASDITSQQIVEALPFDIPEDTRDAILKAMRKDKGDRTSSVALLASNLGVDIDFQSGEGSVTRLLNVGNDTTPVKISNVKKPIIYGVIALAVIGGAIWFVNRPKPTPSELLTEAIQENDLESLRKFVELDSARAFLPYSELLLKQGDFEGAILNANKALVTSDSIRAAEVINIATTNIQNQKEAQEEAAAVSQETPAETPEEVVPSESPEETDAQKFQRAKASNDQTVLLSLANKGYAQAYLPVAQNYFNSGNKKQAEIWAKKAVAANVDKAKAQSLLDKINPPESSTNVSSPTSNTDDKALRLQTALKDPLRGGTTLVMLAEHEHYVPAYYHYARQLLLQGKTNEAKQYLKLSIEKGVNTSQCKQLMEALED